MGEADMEKHAGWKQAAEPRDQYYFEEFQQLALTSDDLQGSLTTH